MDAELDALVALVADQPGLAAAHAALATALEVRGRAGEALAHHRQAAALIRLDAAAIHYNLGGALAMAGDHPGALAALRTAVALRPGWLDALDNLAIAALAAEAWAEADAAARAALAVAPAHAAAHLTLAHLADRAGDADQARHHLRAAVAAAPDLLDAQLALAQRALAAGDTDEATAAATAAAAHGPADPRPPAALGASRLRAGDAAGALDAYRRARDLAPARADLHHGCGVAAEAADRHADAIAHYRAALAVDPAHLPSLANLARLLVDAWQFDELEGLYLRMLALAPDDPLLPHLLDAVRGAAPAAAPPGYVVAVFDALAPRFDHLLVDQLRYRGPEALRAALADRLPARRFGRAIDLGCGTGLVGAALRDRVDHLTGVDLAPRMLDQARARGGYDALIEADAVAFLRAAPPASVDLITAGDVVIYLGDLAPLVAAAAAALAPGGALAFTVERCDDRPWRLTATGRFAHHRDYLAELAAAHQLTLTVAPLEVRVEAGAPVPGWTAVAVRG